MEKSKTELLRHIELEVNQRKVDVDACYAELKMKLPTYIRTLTIGDLRQAGAIVDCNIYFPGDTLKRLNSTNDIAKKRLDVLRKIDEIREQHKTQIKNYYESLREKQTKEFLKKKMAQLDTDDWLSLGITIRK